MPDTDSHGRPIIVAANWFGKLGAQPRKLKPSEQPTSQPRRQKPLRLLRPPSRPGETPDGA